MDSTSEEEDSRFNDLPEVTEYQRTSPFDECGEYRKTTVVHFHDLSSSDTMDNHLLPYDMLYQQFSDGLHDSELVDDALETYFDAYQVYESQVNHSGADPESQPPPPVPPPTAPRTVKPSKIDYDSKLPYLVACRSYQANLPCHHPVCSHSNEYSFNQAL
mmetsp:Transcript_23942/g.36427  ORF Transcript_23942/g.36427 Transcript_23942/m.36427 type:complete len:160 (+) Transcript_23942:189-668(+)